MLIFTLCLSLFATIIIVIISLQRNIAYMEKLDELTDGIQAALDILDEQYHIIDQKTKIEVFSDEPVIRNLVQDIAIARDSILIVAKLLDNTVIAAPETKTDKEK